MADKQAIVPVGKIENRILLIRGEKVIIDADLADFYGVPTKRLNEQVKRNANRFPDDFMFQLTKAESPFGFHRTRRLAGRKCPEFEKCSSDERFYGLCVCAASRNGPDK